VNCFGEGFNTLLRFTAKAGLGKPAKTGLKYYCRVYHVLKHVAKLKSKPAEVDQNAKAPAKTQENPFTF
jgi:hypothetical protein